MADSALTSLIDDRRRFGRVLLFVGAVGVVGALVAGVAGWILATGAADSLTATLEPVAGVVIDISDTIEASQVMVARTVDAIESIEDATRSTARALGSVGDVIGETATLAGSGVADSLESAVDTLPALIDTGRVVDRTMRALSLVGVDYDPEVPLDESLRELEESLEPIPDQVRAQVALLDDVSDDLDQIATDAGSLAAVLLETRIEMMEAEGTLASAAENAAAAAEQVTLIQSDLETYDTLAKVLVVAVTLALLAAASAPLAIGARYVRAGTVADDASRILPDR